MIGDDFAFGLPPDAALITGPVGSGKTEAALDAILDARQFAAFGTIWVLLATGQQIRAFQERLLARSPDAVQFGVEFFNVEALYARLLDLFGDPQRQIGDTALYQILRSIAADLTARGELEHYAEIAQKPGFIGQVAGLIHDLKQDLIRPEQFAQVARSRGPKDRDLARIYAAYQAFLRERGLVDRHGAGWLAVEHLERGDPLPVPLDLLVVDGFDQFDQVHVRLLAALARRAGRTVLTLVGTPGEAGRRFRRFEHTRERLLSAGFDDQGRQVWQDQAVSTLRLEEESAGNRRSRPAPLDYLVHTVFHSHPEQVPGNGTVALIEAPDTGREVRAVLRRIKRLLLDGAAPESMVVIARDMARYSGALRATSRAYGVPLVVREGVPLRNNPAVAVLLSLINLAALDFPRRDVLDALRSPYLRSPDLSPGQVAHLERISLARQVVRGREIWLDEIGGADRYREDEDGERSSLLDSAGSAALRAALARHFDRVTPPPTGTVYAFARWIEGLIGPDPEAEARDSAEVAAGGDGESTGRAHPAAGEALPGADAGTTHFSLLARIRAGADSGRVARDLAAIHALTRVLRGIVTAHDLTGSPADMAWPDFRAELELAVNRACVVPVGGLSRLGRVLAVDALEARGLPHDHVFLLGLSEGVFPAQEPDDTLYQESERRGLERQGIPFLTTSERADDMSLFYEVIGLARRSLTFSRFTADDRRAPCPPSPYWHAVRAAVFIPDGEIEHVRTGAAPSLDEAATLSEAAVAVAAVWAGEHPEGEIPAAGVYNALLDHPQWGERWRGVVRGRAIEAQREDPACAFDRYSGLLANPDLIAAARAAVGPDHIWSASQFNEYGVCPFRFFARRLLALEELKEPEEGLDQLQFGHLNHAILERTYRQVAAEGLSMAPENQDRALAILEDVTTAVFARAPFVYGFRASPVWAYEQQEMLRRLRWLVAQDFSDDSPFRPPSGRENRPVAAAIQGAERQPFGHELTFGLDDQPPLAIDSPAEPVLVRGKIDRLDRAGENVIVIDYKTGSAPHPVSDIETGRDFQMVLYLLAAQALLPGDEPLAVAGGLFWHLRSRKVSGEVLAGHAALEQARERLHMHVLAAREGQFSVSPNGGRCASRCEFQPLCRLSRAYMRKRSAYDDRP
jgi:ATP-dependent helicase/DNAse subunit B